VDEVWSERATTPARIEAALRRIVAEPVPVHDGDTVDTLRARVQAVEHRLLPETVRGLIE
jgi:folate-dependent phosphoribosylglycinamide formyltransferase PurN